MKKTHNILVYKTSNKGHEKKNFSNKCLQEVFESSNSVSHYIIMRKHVKNLLFIWLIPYRTNSCFTNRKFSSF